MNTAVVMALAACLAFTVAGPWLARALPPAAAVRMLVPASLLSAGSAVFVLGVVTFTWLGQVAEVARWGSWSPQTLHALTPIPSMVGVATGTLLVPIGAWTLVSGWLTARALVAVHREGQRFAPETDSPVVIVESGDLEAFTLPGRWGKIVITTGMLAALDADYRPEEGRGHRRQGCAAVHRPALSGRGCGGQRWPGAATGARLAASRATVAGASCGRTHRPDARGAGRRCCGGTHRRVTLRAGKGTVRRSCGDSPYLTTQRLGYRPGGATCERPRSRPGRASVVTSRTWWHWLTRTGWWVSRR